MAKKKKKSNNVWFYAILFLFIGAIILYVINNWTTKPAYEFISCTNNQHSCNMSGWDGICTDDIEDECCDYVDIRWCEGIVQNPYECQSKYCEQDGKMCVGQYLDATGNYECVCTSIST